MTMFNSRDPACKAPCGAARCGESVRFTLRLSPALGVTQPHLFCGPENAPREYPMAACPPDSDGNALFSVSVTPDSAGLWFYWFDLYSGFRKLFRGDFGEAYLTVESTGPHWQLTVYEPDFSTPAQLQGGMLYQIFPDRFYEGTPNKPMPFSDRVYRPDKAGEPYYWPNEQQDGYLNRDYYGGDLLGIQKKLPYLAQLGVTLLYLNPIFEAHANHRYNTANYRRIDPLLGTAEDFAALCHEAKKYGIGVILDGVFSHTGSDSLYFNREGRYGEGGAFRDAHSPYRRWYDFSERYACGYRSWWGFASLPEVNESEPSYRSFICGPGGVIDYWMSLGASGFRLDVADELPDSFIAAIRKAVKAHGEDKYLLGEVWEDATTKWSYGERRRYLLGHGLDAVMNYPFKDAIVAFLRGGDALDAARVFQQIAENYPQPALHLLMNPLSTHDTVRLLTALAGEECGSHDRTWQSGRRLAPPARARGLQLARLAYALLFFLPGIPCVYYGDEIGMQGYKDPFNRGYYEWDNTELSLKQVICALAPLRRENPALAHGSLAVPHAQGGVLCLERFWSEAPGGAGSGSALSAQAALRLSSAAPEGSLSQGALRAAALCVNRTSSAVSVSLLNEEVSVPPMDYIVKLR